MRCYKCLRYRRVEKSSQTDRFIFPILRNKSVLKKKLKMSMWNGLFADIDLDIS